MQLIVPTYLLALAAMASAHTTLQYVNDNNAIVRPPPSNSPIVSVSDSNIACNVNGGTAKSSKLNVTAGGSLTLEWHHEGRTSQAIDPSHKGPVLTYLAKVPNALTATSPSSLSWFKIQHDGATFSGTTATWAIDKLNSNGGKYSVTIPKSIPSGDYLIRSEIIALHGASSVGGAQFYMGCAQISVTGGGSASPATVKFPGAYSSSDPGILINIYYPPLTSYTIPGPAVFSG